MPDPALKPALVEFGFVDERDLAFRVPVLCLVGSAHPFEEGRARQREWDVGSLLDSLLGATIQAQYAVQAQEGGTVSLTELKTGEDGRPNRLVRGFSFVNNDMVNFASCALATLLGVLLAPRSFSSRWL